MEDKLLNIVVADGSTDIISYEHFGNVIDIFTQIESPDGVGLGYTKIKEDSQEVVIIMEPNEYAFYIRVALISGKAKYRRDYLIKVEDSNGDMLSSHIYAVFDESGKEK